MLCKVMSSLRHCGFDPFRSSYVKSRPVKAAQLGRARCANRVLIVARLLRRHIATHVNTPAANAASGTDWPNTRLPPMATPAATAAGIVTIDTPSSRFHRGRRNSGRRSATSSLLRYSHAQARSGPATSNGISQSWLTLPYRCRSPAGAQPTSRPAYPHPTFLAALANLPTGRDYLIRRTIRRQRCPSAHSPPVDRRRGGSPRFPLPSERRLGGREGGAITPRCVDPPEYEALLCSKSVWPRFDLASSR